MKKRRSFKKQILLAFCMVSVIPVIMIGVWSFVNSFRILSSNTDELIQMNLNQTRKSVRASLDAYSDLLYQVYTSDSIVELTNLLNNNIDPAVNRNRLRLELKSYAYAKSNIGSIMIITESGEAVFYDMLASAYTRNSWSDNFEYAQEDLYDILSDSSQKIIFPSQYACTIGGKSYYLFHMGNRIIDYRNVTKKVGVALLSIDETILNEACNEENSIKENGKYGSTNFIVDQNGKLVTFVDPAHCGSTITESVEESEKIKDYKEYVKKSGVLTGEQLAVHTLYDEELQWTFVNVSDQSMTVFAMKEQQKIIVLTICISAITLIIIMILLSNHLTASIQQIIKAMKKVETGNMSVQIASNKNMSTEIATIAEQFNQMLTKVNESVVNEKEAFEKQKDAEIAMLEAQIDPHFIYNILDTVNWMAIDRDQYEISNTINALGKILRYGINQSNHIVEIREEIEWLKQYIFLHQMRMKNTFTCEIHVDPGALNYHIHKLLFQPFVENAILHGFEGIKQTHLLEIEIEEAEDAICIQISDNGKGMKPETVDKLQNKKGIEDEDKRHIGIRNAIGRLKMYYGDEGEVFITSVLLEGTSIRIRIPKI